MTLIKEKTLYKYINMKKNTKLYIKKQNKIKKQENEKGVCF